MVATNRFFQALGRGLSHLLFLIILAGVIACLLLLMPGIAIVSAFADLTGLPISTPLLWVMSIVVSLGIFLSILALMKDSNKSLKLYSGICLVTLSLCFILSVCFEFHFGHRWAKRFLGEPTNVALRSGQ